MRCLMNSHNGVAPTICAGYYKYGVETLMAVSYGTTEVAVLEFYEVSDRLDKR